MKYRNYIITNYNEVGNMAYVINCDELDAYDVKCLKMVYRHIVKKFRRKPLTEEMHCLRCFSRLKVLTCMICIIGGGCFIHLIWFSLLGIPFMVKGEKQKWDGLLTEKHDHDRVTIEK